jgi:hypothetical protein
MSPQGQLMWALFKPLVGLDPNDVNLLEQPLIKDRMQGLLGENYGTAVSLLKTADEIQQQGPLFYLVSKHTPVPDLAEKAGFVWNSETNQMAVMLLTGGSPQVFAEKMLDQKKQEIIPSWPSDLMEYTDPKVLQNKAAEQALKMQADAAEKLRKEAESKVHAGGKLMTEQIQPVDFSEETIDFDAAEERLIDNN